MFTILTHHTHVFVNRCAEITTVNLGEVVESLQCAEIEPETGLTLATAPSSLSDSTSCSLLLVVSASFFTPVLLVGYCLRTANGRRIRNSLANHHYLMHPHSTWPYFLQGQTFPAGTSSPHLGYFIVYNCFYVSAMHFPD